MLYDLRVYTFKPRALPDAERRFGEALPGRERHSRTGGVFHTEFGTLNRMVVFWPYASLADVQQTHEAVAGDPSSGWPPNMSDVLIDAQSSLLAPAPFMESWTGDVRELGGVYELRIYDLKNGSKQQVLDAWAKRIEARVAYSPLVGCWTPLPVGGTQDRLYHLWAYKDLAERARIRDEVVKAGVWPVDDGRHYLRQESWLLVPAPYSPLR